MFTLQRALLLLLRLAPPPPCIMPSLGVSSCIPRAARPRGQMTVGWLQAGSLPKTPRCVCICSRRPRGGARPPTPAQVPGLHMDRVQAAELRRGRDVPGHQRRGG